MSKIITCNNNYIGMVKMEKFDIRSDQVAYWATQVMGYTGQLPDTDQVLCLLSY
jgi:hypothetical protein